MEQYAYFTKAATAMALSFISMVASKLSQISPPSQEWLQVLDKYGLPLAFCIVLSYAVVMLYKGMREVEKARIKDKEMAIEAYREDASKAEESRAKLTDALNNQARAFDYYTKRTKCPYDTRKLPEEHEEG